jgi:DNA polymerase III alpha subunit (gram-positive type)
MISDNLFFKKNQKYIIFDTETEGLNLVSNRPFQLSWIVCDINKIYEEHNKYIFWKDLKISEDAKRVTKFNYEYYKKNSIDPLEVYKEFSKYAFDESNILICQNIFNFDCYIIKNLQIATNNNIDYSYLNRSIDTKILFMAMQKNIKYNGEIPFLDWQYKVSSIVEKGLKSSQQFMLNYFDIPHDKEKLHEALYDIKMLYEIFKKILPQFEVPDLIKER